MANSSLSLGNKGTCSQLLISKGMVDAKKFAYVLHWWNFFHRSILHFASIEFLVSSSFRFNWPSVYLTSVKFSFHTGQVIKNGSIAVCMSGRMGNLRC